MQAVTLSIPCETFVRLASVAMSLPENDNRSYLRSIYFEQVRGKLIAIATNVKIAAIELIGNFTGPDFRLAVTVDETLIHHAEEMIQYGANYEIGINHMLKYTVVRSTFGYSHPVNMYADLGTKCEFFDWREWLPDSAPNERHGAVFANLYMLHTLAESSPTGMIIFPDVIDNRQPIIVRDTNDDRWLGVFVPSSLDTESGEVKYHSGAKFPDWI